MCTLSQTLLLLATLAAATQCQRVSGLVSLYKGQEGSPAYKFLSDHAFFVRRSRTVPPVLLQLTEQSDAAALQSGATFLRAVLLPEDDAALRRFAEAAGTADKEVRRRLFIGVSVRHSTKRFTGKRFLRILELLGTNYLDLLLIAGQPCGHSERDRLACGRNRVTGAFLHNWRNLVQLARKRRVLNLGLRHYPLTAVRQVHRISTPECLDFPNRTTCTVRLAGGGKNKGKKETKSKDDHKKAKNRNKAKGKKSGHKQKKPRPNTTAKQSQKGPVDIHVAYSMRRAAGNVNFLTVVQAAFNPHHRHRVLRRWCHGHSVVLLADEALGGPHAASMLADGRLSAAADAARLPVRSAILHWALKKRVAVAVSPDEAAEFWPHLGSLAGKTQHLAMIDSTVDGDMEPRYFLVPTRSSSSRRVHNEL